MAKLGIDLSKFKKIAHDKDSATLKHKDGHEFKVALSALHPSSRGDVARMPLHKEEKPVKMADGGKVQKFSDGGDIEKAAADLKEMGSKPEDTSAFDQIGQAQDIMDKVAPQSSIPDQNNPPPASDLLPGTPAAKVTPQEMPKGAEESPDAPKAPEAPSEPVLPQQTPLEKIQESDFGQRFASGIGQEAEGYKAKAAADAQRGNEIMKAQHEQANQLGALQQQAQQLSAAHSQEMANVIEDAKNGHINPNQFIENKDTYDKINTVVGLMMGGYGSGVQGKENPALKYMNDQIDRDIEAQKANMNNKFNLVNAYSKQYGDTMMGTEAAKNLMLAQSIAKVKEAEAKAIGPQAKANLQIQLGQMATQYGTAMAKFGMQDAFYKMGSFDQPGKAGAAEQLIQQANMYDPKMGEQMQKHYVPGVGVSVQEIPEKARDEMMHGQQFLDAVQKARAFSEKMHGFKGEITPALRNQADTITLNLHNSLRHKEGMGVFKPAGEAFEKAMTGQHLLSPLAKWTQEPKLKELETSAVNDFNRLKEAHGLHAPSQVSQHYQEQPKKVPGLKEGYELRTINGKQYQVPVKK